MPAEGRVGRVDALRCLAMTAVIAEHCKLLPFGWLGVWLFFVISGYVVTYSVLARGDAGGGTRALAGFYRRRIRRIFPVYFTYLIVGVLVCLALGSAAAPAALLSLTLFVNNIAMIFGRGEIANWPVGHLWTVSVEMQFYLLYGVALLLAPRRLTLMLLVSMIFVSPLLRLYVSNLLVRDGWQPLESAYAIYAGSFLHMDVFAAGALLAFAQQRGLVDRLARTLALGGIVAMLLYVGIFLSINYAVNGARGIDISRNIISGILWGQYRQVVLYSLVAVAGVGLVALAVTSDPWTNWLLDRRALQRIGRISYGGYVFHALAIWVTIKIGTSLSGFEHEGRYFVVRPATFVVAYILTIGLAELSSRYLESRFVSGRLTNRITIAPESTIGAGVD